MKKKECLKLLRKIKDVAFATVDKYGNPQVRIIDVMTVEDEKLFHSEFIERGRVAISGLTKNFESIRLMGKASLVSDQNNCLHCGLCYELCPVKAIVKREKKND